MKHKNIMKAILGLASMLLAGQGMAQDNTYTSVLSEHTWHRLSVAQEGVYKLDYVTLEAMGIDMTALNPDQIRIFGNPSGALPEKNEDPRSDDLTEMAVYVTGADDGVFDLQDVVLFYGQEPTRWKLIDSNAETYRRERNYFSDSTFYYLCVDSGVEGLRVGEKATLPVEGTTTVITDFPDFVWHEAELMSPYFQGQNWLGECLDQPGSLFQLPMVFPNVVASKPAYMKSQVMGRIKEVSMYYDAWVNDNHVANHAAISKYGDNYYGTMASLNKQITLESDTAEFKLSFTASKSASLYLDYVEILAWRQLKRVGTMFPFRLMPSQFGDDVSAIWVQNTDANYWLWEVTNPMRPMLQNGVLSGGNLVFATDEKTEKRYMMFNPSAALPVTHWTSIANQNVHAIADADMLILTPALFKEQAQALADYHAELDGMLSVVVDVDEIFNEFGTGTPDPSAIRDFVRMVYRRSGGRLQYLTLFGRASADYRNIKGYGNNFVPTYEALANPHHEVSFCTDDFFGMMDDDEGSNSDGRVDIGIGRLPVTTVEEAETVLRKIRHYNDLAQSHGAWKSDLLLVSDDDNTDYVNHNEMYANMFDTINHALTSKKVYVGAYPRVNTSSGVTVPGANADLVQALEKGALMMLYVGHGGVRGLTGEYVFTNSDINALTNYDRMPFVYTATCEFSKYDNPLLVSAGEQMFLNPNGGSVAMFTTCRPTYGGNNAKHSKAFVSNVCQRGADDKPMRFGDIVRLTKNDPLNYSSMASLSNINIRFVLLGDPALRFPEPMEKIAVDKINGVVVDDANQNELHAMSMVRVEGLVNRASGVFDANFNGKLWVRFYDKKSKVKVERYGDGSKDVYYHKDVLYQGQATVTDGRFSVSFQVPKEIMPENGKARFSFYAYDSIRGIDAMGGFDDLTLGGVDPAAIADDEGPKIEFYWNTPEFENGQSVERFGVLYADLYDAQGIYHYDYSLGRDIMLSSNHSIFDRLVLNDRYEPAMNDFRRGRIAIPLNELDPGTYEFSLKVWDTQDNPSEASLWFVVDDDLFLSQVRNFPNPFADETYITMTHVGEDANFDVNIEIFDLMGRPVTRLSQKVSSINGVIEPIRWNGCNDYGVPLRSGVYLYRLTLTDETGFFRTVSQRMVISR
ncbi:MAG: type IX secretion system sortase PorU [Bacteroidales bacterium]|nr:type IX secretion system sortase PorU [Bacteroidales bacterium]